MSDTELAVAPPASDANASPEVEEQKGSEVAPSATVEKPDEVDDTVPRVKGRIDELTKHRREAERRAERAERDADYWREQAQRQAPKAEPTRVEPDSDKPKTLADFNWDEVALQEHQRKLIADDARRAARDELARERKEQEQQRNNAEFAKRETVFSKSVSDYDEFALGRNPSISVARVSAEMRDAILTSEEGPALAYFLGRNEDVFDRLVSLPPIAAAREIGRIEARLISEREKAKEKPVSKAPAPPPKIEGNDTVIDKNPVDMSPAQFAKWRKKFMK